MVTAIEPLFREQLIDRRQRLESAATTFHRPEELTRLLHEVDAALHRMDTGVFGLCEVCHDPVEPERLLANPLLRVCLGDLTPHEQRSFFTRTVFRKALTRAARSLASIAFPCSYRRKPTNDHTDCWISV